MDGTHLIESTLMCKNLYLHLNIRLHAYHKDLRGFKYSILSTIFSNTPSSTKTQLLIKTNRCFLWLCWSSETRVLVQLEFLWFWKNVYCRFKYLHIYLGLDILSLDV